MLSRQSSPAVPAPGDLETWRPGLNPATGSGCWLGGTTTRGDTGFQRLHSAGVWNPFFFSRSVCALSPSFCLRSARGLPCRDGGVEVPGSIGRRRNTLGWYQILSGRRDSRTGNRTGTGQRELLCFLGDSRSGVGSRGGLINASNSRRCFPMVH